jgi:hypothetical protein
LSLRIQSQQANVISTSVRGVRGNVRIDTTNRSASARIAAAMSGVDVKEKPRTNSATASSDARAANGRTEGPRRALQSGKRAAAKRSDVAALTIVPRE